VTQGGMTVRLEDERSARSVDEMIERLREECAECRKLLREACDNYDESTMWLLTDDGWEWYEAARKATGGEG